MRAVLTREAADDVDAPLPVEPPGDAPAVEEASTLRRRLPMALQLPPWLRADAPGLLWLGIGLAGIGFVLIAVAWGQVAGETQVALQLPYLVSAGLTGVAVVLLGATVLAVAARRRDAIEHERRMEELVAVLEELKRTMAERGQR